MAGTLGGILQNAMEMFVADIWLTDKERNLPITLYTLVLVAGVTLGPVFGAIAKELSWRWVFYRQEAQYYYLAGLVRIPGSHKQPVERQGLHFRRFSQVYAINYGFSDAASGLTQSALFIGEVIGFFACLPQNKYYQQSTSNNPVEAGSPVPEARLPLSIPASLLGLAGGLFWYGWSSYPHIHWILPTVGLALVGFGIMVIVNTVDLYITDAYAKYAGSAIAAVALGENIFAAWLPLAANSMYSVLGFQWASSLLGFVGLCLTFAPIGLLFKGESVRRRSKYITEASYTS
ncbi:MAG: hypothetical protein Q9201_006717 [Fulgogasparrea decipioides]